MKWIKNWLKILNPFAHPFDRWMVAHTAFGVLHYFPCILVSKYLNTKGNLPYMIFADDGETLEAIDSQLDRSKLPKAWKDAPPEKENNNGN